MQVFVWHSWLACTVFDNVDLQLTFDIEIEIKCEIMHHYV